MIFFSFEEMYYTTDAEAYDLNIIVLPDGRVLEVEGWLESNPPKPAGLHETKNLFASKKPEDIAKLMNGVVARPAKWIVKHGIHRGTLVSRDSTVDEFETEEEAREYFNKQKRWYKSNGYQIWYACLITPEGKQITLERGNPYY